MNISIEVTDTANGHTNYSWIKRVELQVTDCSSRLSIVRQVKRAIGWNGIPCQVNEVSDWLELRRPSANMVAFVEFDD